MMEPQKLQKVGHLHLYRAALTASHQEGYCCQNPGQPGLFSVWSLQALDLLA